MARIAAENKGIAAFYDRAKLHTFTQRLFGRLMFLYFLQKKGALNDEKDFVTARYQAAVRADENFYRESLEPLFFETLNCEATKRSRDQRVARFGRVPYLNGGLFAADEDDHVGVVYLDNALFDVTSDTGLLNFLNRYNFTIEEDTPLESQVALTRRCSARSSRTCWRPRSAARAVPSTPHARSSPSCAARRWPPTSAARWRA